jgi:hypothetical protein
VLQAYYNFMNMFVLVNIESKYFKHSCDWKVDSGSVGQESPCSLWDSKVHHHAELELNVLHQLLAYADDVNLPGNNIEKHRNIYWC